MLMTRLKIFATDCMPPGIPLKHPIVVAAPSIEKAAKALKVSKHHLLHHRLDSVPPAVEEKARSMPGIRIVAVFAVLALLAGCAGPAEGPNRDQTVPDWADDFDHHDQRVQTLLAKAEGNATAGRLGIARDTFQSAMYAADGAWDFGRATSNETAAYFRAAYWYAEAGYYCYHGKADFRSTPSDCDLMPELKRDMEEARSVVLSIRAGGP